MDVASNGARERRVTAAMTRGGRLESPALSPSPPQPWRRRGFARGVVLFVVCTAAGLAAVRGRTQWSEARGVLAGLPWWTLAVGMTQVVLDQLLGGLRIWACARGVGAPVAFSTCVGANCANVFLGGVTPSQSGGGPAQIWLLVRGGMPFAAATVASCCTFLGTIATFLTLAVHVTFGSTGSPPPAGLRLFTSATVVVFGLCLVASASALLRPDWVHGPLRRGVARVPRFGAQWAQGARFRALQRLVNDAAQWLGRGMRRGKRWLGLCLLLSFAVYANKFSIAWTVLRGLGVPAAPAAVLHSQELQYLVTYFAPTPGASGFAEYSAVRLVAGVVPGGMLGAYLIAWRTFTLYAGMFLGALVLLRAAGTSPRHSDPRHAAAASTGTGP